LRAVLFSLFGVVSALALQGFAGLSPSPDMIAFQSDRHGQGDVFLIEFNGLNGGSGKGLRRLTEHPADDGAPAWSADGERLAFHSNRSGNYDIYVMNADGSGLERLTDHPADEGHPNWSPDGRWIAFEAERDGRSEIYRVKVDTGRVRRLTTGLALKLGPAHSPDGAGIAFMEKGLIRWQVAILEIATGASRTLTSGGGNCRPVFSPDGKLLAVVSTRESKKADIWLMDLGRDAAWKLITRPGAHNYDPAFSPEGRTLAFASTLSRDHEDWDLYLADLNGRNVKPLTSGPGNDRFPSWRPRP